MRSLKLAILPDYAEERWPSMDLCAEMLSRSMTDREGFKTTTLRPPYRKRAQRWPIFGWTRTARNADRLMNRMRTYPEFARQQADHFDWFHLVDHSYSQLLLDLPEGRCGVLCHDLDTFRCVLDPSAEPRPRWFRAMVRKILDGFGRAAVIFHTTASVRRELLQHGLADDSKLVQVPLGISPEFVRPPLDRSREPFLLHVGSCISRKRIDVLLNVFAEVRHAMPGLTLMQAGGHFSSEQRKQIAELKIGRFVTQRNNLTRAQLASLYQSAAAVLVSSEAEGFGLPVIEAMACGAQVIASDIDPLREVGGDAARYCPVADLPAWVHTVTSVLQSPPTDLAAKVKQASRYSWLEHANVIARTYLRLHYPISPRPLQEAAH